MADDGGVVRLLHYRVLLVCGSAGMGVQCERSTTLGSYSVARSARTSIHYMRNVMLDYG